LGRRRRGALERFGQHAQPAPLVGGGAHPLDAAQNVQSIDA